MTKIYAKVNSENVVTNVILADDAFINSYDHFDDSRFIEGSADGSIRKNHPVIGGTYSEEHDAFIGKKPYASWILNTETCTWEPPTPTPTEGYWHWDETTTSWIEYESLLG